MGFTKSSRLIGDEMSKLFKDDHLYEKELIGNPNFKLHSLRDFSALDIAKLAASQDDPADKVQDY